MADYSEDRIVDESARHGELLLYDFFKHMTTLSLVTLGGVLSISQTSGVAIPMRDLLPAILLIAVAGATSLYSMESMIKLRLANLPLTRSIRWQRLVASGSFGLGIGAFLGRFGDFI